MSDIFHVCPSKHILTLHLNCLMRSGFRSNVKPCFLKYRLFKPYCAIHCGLGGVWSLINYSVAYAETQSNRVFDFHSLWFRGHMQPRKLQCCTWRDSIKPRPRVFDFHSLWSRGHIQPRKLQCCIWRDSIKPSLRLSWFCVFFVSKRQSSLFWLLFYSTCSWCCAVWQP